MNEPVLSLTGICKSYNPGQANEVRVLQSCDLTLMGSTTRSAILDSNLWMPCMKISTSKTHKPYKPVVEFHMYRTNMFVFYMFHPTAG